MPSPSSVGDAVMTHVMPGNKTVEASRLGATVDISAEEASVPEAANSHEVPEEATPPLVGEQVSAPAAAVSHEVAEEATPPLVGAANSHKVAEDATPPLAGAQGLAPDGSAKKPAASLDDLAADDPQILADQEGYAAPAVETLDCVTAGRSSPTAAAPVAPAVVAGADQASFPPAALLGATPVDIATDTSIVRPSDVETVVDTSSVGTPALAKEQGARDQRHAVLQISRPSLDSSDDSVWKLASTWQVQPWNPERGVGAYLSRFGFEAKSKSEWLQKPSDSLVKLDMNLAQHVEGAGSTWYRIECQLTQRRTSAVEKWSAARRLCQIRTSLHDRVVEALGSRYNWLFEDAHFAIRGAPRGTTARLHAWLCTLAENINDGTLSPEIAALTLFFLQAPARFPSGEEMEPFDFYSPPEATQPGLEP